MPSMVWTAAIFQAGRLRVGSVLKSMVSGVEVNAFHIRLCRINLFLTTHVFDGVITIGHVETILARPLARFKRLVIERIERAYRGLTQFLEILCISRRLILGPLFQKQIKVRDIYSVHCMVLEETEETQGNDEKRAFMKHRLLQAPRSPLELFWTSNCLDPAWSSTGRISCLNRHAWLCPAQRRPKSFRTSGKPNHQTV